MILAVFINGRQKGFLDFYDLRRYTRPFMNGKAKCRLSLMNPDPAVGAGLQAVFICEILRVLSNLSLLLIPLPDNSSQNCRGVVGVFEVQ